jgi:hypothetical protein
MAVLIEVAERGALAEELIVELKASGTVRPPRPGAAKARAGKASGNDERGRGRGKTGGKTGKTQKTGETGRPSKLGVLRVRCNRREATEAIDMSRFSPAESSSGGRGFTPRRKLGDGFGRGVKPLPQGGRRRAETAVQGRPLRSRWPGHAHRGDFRHSRPFPGGPAPPAQRSGGDLASRRRVRAGHARRVRTARTAAVRRGRQLRRAPLAADARPGARGLAVPSRAHPAAAGSGGSGFRAARTYARAARRD